MTYQEREEIFSKEALSIKDVAALLECSDGYAGVLIRNWKSKLQFRGNELRLETDGKIHIMDYFEVMDINGDDPGERYFRKKPKEKSSGEHYLEETHQKRRSLCI